MLDFFKTIFRVIWPPHHSAPAEELHAWRIGMAMSQILLATTMVVHIVMAERGAERFHPGYVKTNELIEIKEDRKRSLRLQILDLHVKQCTSRGTLAQVYNQQLNELLAYYRKIGGNTLQLPDCGTVRHDSTGTQS